MRCLRLLLALCLLPCLSCKPPLRITYDIVGTAAELLTSDGKCRVVVLKGPGDWTLTVEADVSLPGSTKASPPTLKRDYHPADEKVEVFLEDFLGNDGTPVDGRYTFRSILEGGSSPHVLPPSTIVLDRTPPEILGIGPGEGSITPPLADGSEVVLTEPRLLIAVKDRSPAELLVDGAKVNTGAQGAFELKLTFPHTPEYQLEATDAAGNRTACRIRVLFDRSEPVIRWPEALHDFAYQSELPLELAVEDDTAVDLLTCKLNGKAVPIERAGDGRCHLKLYLDTGKNHVIVEARDRAGRRSVATRSIEYDPSRVEVKAQLTGSTEAPAYTRERKCRAAVLEGLGERQATVSTTFQPISRAPPRDTQRRFRATGGELEVFLNDLTDGANELEEGLYNFSISVDGLPPAGNPRAGAIWVDRTKPVLVLLTGRGERKLEPAAEDPSPADALELVVRGEEVAARLLDAGPCRLSIDGELVEPGSDGSYKLPVRSAALKLAADDAAGNRSTWNILLVPDREEPVLQWVDLPPGGVVGAPELRLECRVRDDSGVEKVLAKLNGETLDHEVLEAGLLAIPLRVKPGNNELAVKVADLSGKELTSTVTLTLKDAPLREYPALVESGGTTIFLIEDDRGQPCKWALPPVVMRIEAVPGKRGIFNVTTPTEREHPMALVPGGRFAMGLDPSRKETLTPFLMDVFEVTVERFEAFRKSKGSSSNHRTAKELNDPAQPAVVVSWDEAAEFAAGTGHELPAALEWEFAASWDRQRRLQYPWGDSFGEGGVELAWLAVPPRVGSLLKDVSPWGILGLGAGVREWCVDPVPGRPESRCIRGGSAVNPRRGWTETKQLKPELFLSAREGSAARTSRMIDVGFRCVLRLVPPEGK